MMFSMIRSFFGRNSVKSKAKSRVTNRGAGSLPGLETLESRLTPSAVTENQVVNLYRAFLNRVPEAPALAAWSRSLEAGRLSVEQMAGMILESHEYGERVVKQSFSEYLGRAPGSVGLSSYVTALGHGVSQERVDASILGSKEYFAKQDSGNIPFVQSLYSKVLGREAEAAGLEGYVAELSRGVTRTQVAHAILGSVEYGKLVTADAYQAILGRDASAPELLSWAKSYSQSANGTKAVWTGVVGSSEGTESLSAPGVVQNFIGNSIGIVTDGTPFTGGGFDGDGNAYSYQTLGFSQTLPWNGVTFDLGSPNQPNVLVSGGQTIPVPQGGFNVLNLAGAAVNGSQQNQQIRLNFSDGSSVVWTQSFSDWGGPQNYGHESIISTQSYRDTASGGTQQFTNHVYGYSYTIPTGKTLASITLPINQNVRFLDLQMSTSTMINLSGSYTSWGIANGSTQVANHQGFDSKGYYYYSGNLQSTITWSGATFTLGPVPTTKEGENNFVRAGGQTINIPYGQDGSLYLAGAGSNGSQDYQTFIMHFSDGSTANWTQSFSDWCKPSNFPGESIIQMQPQWVNQLGNINPQTNYVYGYAYQIPANKTLVSVTLPNNPSNLGILGMAIVGSVDLTTIGIVTDGTPFTGGGFDGDGNAYSYEALGSSQTLPWNGVTFDLGSPNQPNYLVAGGQTILVPKGGNVLNLAGAAVFGSQQDQQIGLNFSDGSSQVWTQSFSDWGGPQNYGHESIISTQSYRDTASGGTQQFTNHIYGYSYTIPAGKTLASITLPTNQNVRFLDLQMSFSTPVNLSNSYTSWGIANGTKSVNKGEGFDSGGNYYYNGNLQSTIAWGGATFTLGPVPTTKQGENNFVQGKGQTINVPQGLYESLYFAGAGSNGSQQNQTFIMHFTDGSTANWTQSFSDWCKPSNFAGESIIQQQPNWVNQLGNINPQTNYVYGYAYQIPANKTLVSVTLPNNTSNLGILGMTMVASAEPVTNIGIFTDGTPFTNGGFDGYGNAYSYQTLGFSQTLPWNGVTFDLGSPNQPNVLVSGGQTIPVPQGGFNVLNLAGAAVNGSQQNQQIRLNFSDGSSVVWTQSFSNWGSPQNYGHESIISTQSYCDTYSGSTQPFTNHIYGYSYTIPAGKTLASITLPTNQNVRFLDLQMSTSTMVNLSNSYTQWGITMLKGSFGPAPLAATDPTTIQGFDSQGNYYNSIALASSIAWGGMTFNFGTVPLWNEGTNNFVQGKGQTINVPQGQYGSLYFAGAGSNGSQQNQTFTMLFSDGSTANWTQSFSDWCSPSNFAGESIIQQQNSLVANGTWTALTNYVYGYAYQIPAGKTLSSVTLPNNTSNLGILAMAMVPSVELVTTVPVIIPGNSNYTTNEPMVLTAYVAAQDGTVAPTGTVDFYAINSAGVPVYLGTQTLGAPSISFQSPTSEAVLTLAVPNPLAPGQYNVFFQYRPSAQSGFESSTSLESQVTVTAG